MDASSNVVFKVRYGDDLRRFNARIVNGEIDLGMDGLREKIKLLFGFAYDVELMLTYIDEDCDIVSLVDDHDLRDMVRQRLNPIRITAKLKSEKDSKISNGSSGSPTPHLRTSSKREPLPYLNAIAEVSKPLPEAAREALKVLSSGFTSKAPRVAPVATEVVDAFAKLGLSFLVQPSESQVAEEHGSSSSGTAAAQGENSLRKGENLWKASPEATKGKDKAKIVPETEGTSSEKAPEFTVAPPALVDCRKYGSKKEKLKKDKFKNISGSCANKKPHMLVRKLAGSYTVLPTVTPPGMMSDKIGKPDPPKEGYNGGRMGHVAPVGLYGYPGSIWSHPPVGLNGSTSDPMLECPFSGVSFLPETCSSHLPRFPFWGTSETCSSQLPSPTIQLKRSYGQNDGSGLSFHRGVRCDGCGAHPIIGPRYKSKVRMDYDLCTFCFPQIGNETDYIKMELPAVYPHLTPFKRMSDSLSGKNFKAKSSASKLDSRFIIDVNIMDGTVMAPLTSFTKIWKMKNNGTTVWPEQTFLLWIGGDKLSDRSSVEVAVPAGGLPVDQELHVSVDFTAPELPGRYVSYWRLVSPSGQKFGQRVWVLIQVDASVKGIEPDTFQALNLNLPPITTNDSSVAEAASVDAEPVPEGGCTEPDSFQKMVELIETLVSSPQENDQELKVHDTSLASDDLLSSAYSPKTSLAPELEQKINTESSDLVSSVDMSVPKPGVHVLDPMQVMNSEAPNHVSSTTDPSFQEPIVEPESSLAPISASQASAPELGEDTDVEARLLVELKQMGFDQVDLNKKVLRMSGYDLEQAVEELCGLSEWDPILDELEEMGFHDTEMNKVLLKKNGGSIKRVVMDLIAGEDDH